jgi:hypothetical protein
MVAESDDAEVLVANHQRPPMPLQVRLVPARINLDWLADSNRTLGAFGRHPITALISIL